MRSLHLLPLAFVAAAAANTTLTFDGTIKVDSPDRVGEAVTITFVLSDNPVATRIAPGDFQDELASDVDLFNSISGTGITGAWSRPINDDPYSYTTLYPSRLQVMASNDNASYSLGLKFYGLDVYAIYLSANFVPSIPVPINASYDELFDGFPTSPAIDEDGYAEILTSAGQYTIELTSLTIVPEPSTYGLILGGLALAGAAIRRRKSAK